MEKVKVGDTVEITKGTDNWNKNMDKFIGRRVIVTKVTDYEHWVDNSIQQRIRFDGAENWTWDSTGNHFKLVNTNKQFLIYN